MSAGLQLVLDILRGRNYPQTETDPCPCSTLVRVLLYNSSLTEKLADAFTTELQPNSNAPFYNAGVPFKIPAGLDSVGLVLEVVETTRKPEPYVMFFGSLIVALASKGKHEEVISLRRTNPVRSSNEEELETLHMVGESASPPVLGIRYQVQRLKETAGPETDNHRDVVLSSKPLLTSGCSLVPKDSQYIWFNITSDARWMEAFRFALVDYWQSRPSFVMEKVSETTQKSGRRPTTTTTKAPAEAAVMSSVPIRSVGDVILKKWCCRRSHEVLTRLRLCAEAFNRGAKSFNFTREQEISFRLQRKERICLLQEIVFVALSNTGCSPLRDFIDHLWIFFAIGVSHDPAGPRTLTYETRRRIKETEFTEEDNVVLQSSLLNFIVPSISQFDCDEIVLADVNSGQSFVSGLKLSDKVTSSIAPSASEVAFSMSIIDTVGAMLDTLTETELLSSLKTFKPAVVEAHQRIKNGGKEEIKQLRSRVSLESRKKIVYTPGNGINIEHLDRLGHRKKKVEQ